MKKSLISIIFLIAFSLTGFGQIDKIVGNWKSIDDEDGTAKSIVHIFKATNGKYYGKIEKLFKNPDKLCIECKGENYNKPIKGMRIINDMVIKGSALSGGTILDPNNGKVYKCTISYNDKTGKLDVRGSLDKAGVFGSTKIWVYEYFFYLL
jgi:uncharacterized protein (DUF2147 family)